MQVIEQYLCGKAVDSQCEDMIYVGTDYIAVIDGVTSKTGKTYSGSTQGFIGASIVKTSIENLNPDETSVSAVTKITETIASVYKKNELYNLAKTSPIERFSSTAVIYSKYRNEVWFIGSCQGYINNKHIFTKSKSDLILAEARALYLHSELAKGVSQQELLERDTGRGFIYPMLCRESVFENLDNDYGYGVFNGITVPKVDVHVINPLISTEVVLASDGYPTILPTLKDSEELLEYTLRADPLRINQFKSTKGIKPGNVSFDDRAYIRFTV